MRKLVANPQKKQYNRTLRHLKIAEANLILADEYNRGFEPISAPLHNALACCQGAISRALDCIALRDHHGRKPPLPVVSKKPYAHSYQI